MRHITGEMKKIQIPDNVTLDEFCKQIIENEFMDKVYEEFDSLEELVEENFDECDGYGAVLNYLDYESDKYFVFFNPNIGDFESVWEVIKKEELKKEPICIKTSVENEVMKFDVIFDEEDDGVGIYCLENALNCDNPEYWDIFD